MVTKRITEIQFNSPSIWFFGKGAINWFLDIGRDMSLAAIMIVIVIVIIILQISSGLWPHNAKPNDKTKGNENNADERSHVEAQSPLAVSLGPLQFSNHLHVSCLRQGEQKERLTSEFYVQTEV